MSFKELVGIFITYVNAISAVIIGLLIAIFIFNIVKGIAGSNSAEGRKKLQNNIIFGLIAIFFAVSFVAVARFIAAGFGL